MSIKRVCAALSIALFSIPGGIVIGSKNADAQRLPCSPTYSVYNSNACPAQKNHTPAPAPPATTVTPKPTTKPTTTPTAKPTEDVWAKEMSCANAATVRYSEKAAALSKQYYQAVAAIPGLDTSVKQGALIGGVGGAAAGVLGGPGGVALGGVVGTATGSVGTHMSAVAAAKDVWAKALDAAHNEWVAERKVCFAPTGGYDPWNQR